MKRLRITIEGKAYEVTVESVEPLGSSSASTTTTSAPVTTAAPVTTPQTPTPAPAPVAAGSGDVVSPLAAVVVEVHVKPGNQVNAGDKLITLEAMKMNTFVNAPAAGTIDTVNVQAGASVEEGQSLLKLR